MKGDARGCCCPDLCWYCFCCFCCEAWSFAACVDGVSAGEPRAEGGRVGVGTSGEAAVGVVAAAAAAGLLVEERVLATAPLVRAGLGGGGGPGRAAAAGQGCGAAACGGGGGCGCLMRGSGCLLMSNHTRRCRPRMRLGRPYSVNSEMAGSSGMGGNWGAGERGRCAGSSVHSAVRNE